MGGAKVARRYLNPAKSLTLVSEATLAEAQTRLDGARERLRAVEEADPSSLGWDSAYDGAASAVRAAERRLEALASLRAAQVERSGKRADAVKAAGKELEGIAKGLAASRDAVASAAAEHLRALAGLAMAVDAHNGKLAAGRARLAALGLAVRDDLVDTDRGEEHPEGTLDRGLRAGATDWTPVEARALADHARLQVFKDPATQAARFRLRPYEVDQRADGLALPSLASIGAAVPQEPEVAAIPPRPSVRELADDPVLAVSNPDWRPRAKEAVG
jgi:hypothetical protein